MDDAEWKLSEDFWAFLQTWVERRDKLDLLRSRLKTGGPGDFDGAVAITAELLKAVDPGPLKVGEDVIDGMFLLDEYLPVDYNESDLKALIEKAHSDFYAYQVLKYVDQQHPFSGQFEVMKMWRRSCYLGIFVPPDRPPGPGRLRNLFRDRAIVREIHALIEAGFTATRNRVRSAGTMKEHHSACDVVSKALETSRHALGYSAAEKVWNNRDKLAKAKSIGNLFVEGVGRGLSEKIDGDHTV